jgi:hypothetical protein
MVSSPCDGLQGPTHSSPRESRSRQAGRGKALPAIEIIVAACFWSASSVHPRTDRHKAPTEFCWISGHSLFRGPFITALGRACPSEDKPSLHQLLRLIPFNDLTIDALSGGLNDRAMRPISGIASDLHADSLREQIWPF